VDGVIAAKKTGKGNPQSYPHQQAQSGDFSEVLLASFIPHLPTCCGFLIAVDRPPGTGPEEPLE
jgi:hypothetical protein